MRFFPQNVFLFETSAHKWMYSEIWWGLDSIQITYFCPPPPQVIKMPNIYKISYILTDFTHFLALLSIFLPLSKASLQLRDVRLAKASLVEEQVRKFTDDHVVVGLIAHCIVEAVHHLVTKVHTVGSIVAATRPANVV